jgi:phage protein D/phage baseplate assembly protein gpV
MTADAKLIDHFFIKVDGTDLAAEIMNEIHSVTVDIDLDMPDMCVIGLHDEKLKFMDEGPFILGKDLEISALPEEGGPSLTIFKGEIIGIEPEFSAGTQAGLTVRAFNRLHRLSRGKHSLAYLQVTDKDIVTQIAQRAGLRVQVDDTKEVYPHVYQHNQSDLEFLKLRAERIGFVLLVNDKTLVFRKLSSLTNESEPIELEWGRAEKGLHRFTVRMTTTEQVDEVIVRGWNPKTKKEIVGHASNPQVERNGGKIASDAFGSAKTIAVDQPIYSQAEADTIAKARLDEISMNFITGEGESTGLPKLRPGMRVKCTALGQRFSGTYFVTSVSHRYRAHGAYMTTFRINKTASDTLGAMIESAPEKAMKERSSGPVIGIVTNNKDPEGWGRVKVKFPWMADDVESDWARLIAPGAGQERGFYALPEVNDEVLVSFEHGDIGKPFVLGGLWNGQGKPPLQNSKALENGKVHQGVYKTRAGHTLTFTDGSDQGVVIETAGGHRITLADEKKKVLVETSGGQKLTFDDGSNEVSVESTGNLTIKSGGNLTIDATGSLSIKGNTFSINSNTAGEVKAGAVLEVKGSLVKIN